MSEVNAAAIAAFIALTLALAALWIPRITAAPGAAQAWMLPGAIALVLAFIAGITDSRGTLLLFFFGVVCFAAHRATGRAMRATALVLMLAACAALFLHIVPGIQNPRVVADLIVGHDAIPYTKYLNFDKGIAGLFLLGLYAPDRPATDDGLRNGAGFVWRFAIVVAVTMTLSLALGYVRWDPKLPSWWPLWTWSMIFLTALPEEALFRGVVLTSIQRWLDARTPHASAIAIVAAGILFGIVHVAGGPAYVLLASVAGIGYGWIYSSTRSIGAAILAHAGLNTIHFLLFTYPALHA